MLIEKKINSSHARTRGSSRSSSIYILIQHIAWIFLHVAWIFAQKCVKTAFMHAKMRPKCTFSVWKHILHEKCAKIKCKDSLKTDERKANKKSGIFTDAASKTIINLFKQNLKRKWEWKNYFYAMRKNEIYSRRK